MVTIMLVCYKIDLFLFVDGHALETRIICLIHSCMMPLQEMMRNNDRQMAQLENIPGGFDLLR